MSNGRLPNFSTDGTYDVIVVGGGPVGSFTAWRLADLGLEVALFEEDGEAGRGVICTGIISSQGYRMFDLPKEAVISELSSFSFFSPSLLSLGYSSSDPLAYVVDRDVFDKELLRRAEREGVDVRLGKCILGIEVGRSWAEVLYNGDVPGRAKAKAVVLATGNRYRLARELGLGQPSLFLQGAQLEAYVSDLEGTEIYVGRDIAPGSFAWVVPIGDSRARIGVLTRDKAALYLKRFLNTRLRGRLRDGNPKIFQKKMAHGPLPRSVSDRVLAVGEAAGQVKTTTGGGLFYGFLCSEMAVKVLKRGLDEGDLSKEKLAEYERAWRSEIGEEQRMGHRIRGIIARLSDKYIDKLFEYIKRREDIRRRIEKRVNFDYHSDLVSIGVELLGFTSRRVDR